MRRRFIRMAATVGSALLVGASCLLAGCSNKPVILNDDDEAIATWGGQAGYATAATAGEGTMTMGSGEGTDASGSVTDSTRTPGRAPTQKSDIGKTANATKATTKVTGTTSAPAPAVKRVVAQVKQVGGVPRLYLDGKMTTANLFFLNGDKASTSANVYKSEVGYSRAAGFHMYSTIVNLNFGFKEDSNREVVYAQTRKILDNILAADPDAKILLRVSVLASASSRSSQDDRCAFANGASSSRITIASDKWLEETLWRTKDLVSYLRGHADYADHVFGYHLDLGEWFPENFTVSPDVSATNSKKYREWLTAKYKTDAALQAAWGSRSYTLAKVTVPLDLPVNDGAHDGLFLSQQDARFIDYYTYWNELTASRIEDIAKTIKQASNQESVVISFYGYYFEQYHATTGHWDFRRLLESKYLDGFASPTTYMDRGSSGDPLTGTSGYMTTADSVVRAGKLWVMESDQRTFINRTEATVNTTSWPPLKTISAIEDVHKREIGIAMVHGTSMYPMDLMGLGWYDYDEIWTHFSRLDKAYMAYAAARKTKPTYDVALVVDEKATMLVGRNSAINQPAMAQMMLRIYRAGISFSLVEIGDLYNGRADDYGTYIFINPFRLSSAQIDSLAKKLHTGNKTAVYLYNFGNASAADMKKLTGMDMATAQTKADHTLQLTSQTKIPGLEGMASLNANPLTTVIGGYTTVLGKYGNGQIGAALYEGNGYRSLFIGTNSLSTAANIRAIARYAGATIYCETEDTLVANDDMVMLSAATAGKKTVHFPGKVDVYDYFRNKWYTGVSSVELGNMAEGDCRWLFYGSKATIQAMKLPAWK